MLVLKLGWPMAGSMDTRSVRAMGQSLGLFRHHRAPDSGDRGAAQSPRIRGEAPAER